MSAIIATAAVAQQQQQTYQRHYHSCPNEHVAVEVCRLARHIILIVFVISVSCIILGIIRPCCLLMFPLSLLFLFLPGVRFRLTVLVFQLMVGNSSSSCYRLLDRLLHIVTHHLAALGAEYRIGRYRLPARRAMCINAHRHSTVVAKCRTVRDLLPTFLTSHIVIFLS